MSSTSGESQTAPIHFVVKYKSTKFHLSMNPASDMNEVFDFVGEVIDIYNLHCVLIAGGRKFIQSDSDSGVTVGDILSNKSTVMLVSSSNDEIDKIRKFKSDPLVKGFAEEERDEEMRRVKAARLARENPWGEKASQDPEFNFGKIEAMFRRTKPTPYEAEKLLRKLTLDPGIREIMKTQRFKVLTLCEIDPEDADQEQAAKGEGDKCLLGWNRNFGERIALRLRTDDLTSFRKYDSIANTLIHELTHNVHGPHDEKFWTLFNSLKEIYARIHSSGRIGHRIGDNMAKNAMDSVIHDAGSVTSHVLGGTKKTDTIAELRNARLQYLAKK